MYLNIEIQNYTLDEYMPAKLAESTLEVIYDEAVKEKSQDAESHAQLECSSLIFPFARSAIVAVPIKQAKTLVRANEELKIDKCVVELTFNIKNFPLLEDYQPGDTIAILPHNSDANVRKLLSAMRLTEKSHRQCQVQVKRSCTKKTAKRPAYIPEGKTTPYELLRDCLSLHAVIKKQFLRALAECCSAIEECEFLNSLSSKEASLHYNELILDKGLTIFDLLQLCPSCQPSLPMLVEFLPRLLPRPYSIANSPLLKDTNEIRIIFSIRQENPGVTTKMLNQLARSIEHHPIEAPTAIPPPSPKVLLYLRETNRFRYTAEDAASNQILIGVGTAIAPFLGFLEHKQCVSRLSESITSLGQTWLFAGASTQDRILHRDQLLQLHTHSVLNKYFESISRVTAPDAGTFHYVQDQIKENAEQFIAFLMDEPTTVLYVCADGAQISKSIEMTIRACLGEQLNLQESQADEMIKEFRANGKYREDLWT